MSEQSGTATVTADYKTRGELIKRFSKLNNEAENKGLATANIRDAFLFPNVSNEHSKAVNKRANLQHGHGYLATFSVVWVVLTVISAMFGYFVSNKLLFGEEQHCIIKNNDYINAVTRAVLNCNMCRSLTEVPTEYNIGVAEFRDKYAYTSVPVLVKGATRDWKAMSTFSFKWFKDLYQQTPGAFFNQKGEKCLVFMRYSTKFETIEDVFKMSDDRAKAKEGEEPWYIGWMNCKKDIQTALRKHYTRPYFLPNDTESSIINWVFMGGPGPGVPIHLDEVDRPSWQAQISGAKTWTLVPVPECESVCKAMNVTVHKGDIVVVNVNHWYHTTYVHPGEISIAIGSEYD